LPQKSPEYINNSLGRKDICLSVFEDKQIKKLMAISAKDVQNLRVKTGCGMMECKKALTECNGDFEEAVKYLREKGLAVAAKKVDRIAAEGIVDILKSDDGMTTVMVEVNAETDFVAKNATFQEFVKGILNTISINKPADVDALLSLPYNDTENTVEAELKNKIFTIGENMSIRRFALVNGVTGTYIHGKGNVGVIVKFDVDNKAAQSDEFAEFAKNICLQVTAMNPLYLDKSNVPAEIIENEKQILISQIKNDEKNANKPDAIVEKMVIGKINKYYDTNCLLEQIYVKDEAMNIAKYVEATAKALNTSISTNSFVKYEKGEGIEKKCEDFAAEIDKMIKG